MAVREESSGEAADRASVGTWRGWCVHAQELGCALPVRGSLDVPIFFNPKHAYCGLVWLVAWIFEYLQL